MTRLLRIDSKNTTIEVCENDHTDDYNHPKDYQIVKEWISQQK